MKLMIVLMFLWCLWLTWAVNVLDGNLHALRDSHEKLKVLVVRMGVDVIKLKTNNYCVTCLGSS